MGSVFDYFGLPVASMGLRMKAEMFHAIMGTADGEQTASMGLRMKAEMFRRYSGPLLDHLLLASMGLRMKAEMFRPACNR